MKMYSQYLTKPKIIYTYIYTYVMKNALTVLYNYLQLIRFHHFYYFIIYIKLPTNERTY